MNVDRLLDKAIEVATTSPGVGPRNCYRVGAVLYKRGKVLAVGTNSYKTHPKLKPFTEWPFIHAESSTILRQGMDNCNGLSLLVARVTKHLDVSCARPCEACMSLCQHVGIRNITYTNWKGQLESINCV